LTGKKISKQGVITLIKRWSNTDKSY